MVSGVLKAFFDIFVVIGKYILAALVACIIPFVVVALGRAAFRLFIKHDKIPHKSKTVKKKYSKSFSIVGFLKKIFLDFPIRYIDDLFERDPDSFDTFGVHIFCGEQGSGKSIAAVHFIKMIQERNPLCHVAGNVALSFEADTLRDWTNILEYNNGIYGQVIFLDEIQNWFSSNESKNFPPAMLTEITQQRKQRKCVVGTSQVFTRMSKPIREQITLLYKPFTILGCFTVVRVYRVSLLDDGSINKARMLKMYCFVHDDELRNAYDTYEKVQRIKLVGFQPRDPAAS